MINKLKKYSLINIRDNDLKDLIKGSSIIFIYKILGLLIGYLITFIIAKYYGADTLGLYTLSLTLINIFVVISLSGFDNSLLKFIPKYELSSDINIIKELYTKSLVFSTTIALIISICFYKNIDFLAKKIFNNKELIFFFKIASFTIISTLFLRFNIAVLKALRKIKIFAFFQNFTLLFLTLLVLIFLLFINNSKENTIIAYSIATFISTFLIYVYTKKYFNIKFIFKSNLNFFEILKISFPMLLSSSMMLVINWTDTLMIGIFSNETNVGIYNIVFKIASLTSISLMIVNSIVTPKFSKLWEKGDKKQLIKIARQSNKIIFLISAPILLISIIFSEFLLEIFGSEFIIGNTALIILVIGQSINIFSGSVGYILQMTGFQVFHQKIIFIGMLINITLNIILIPKYGIIGAATASAISLAIWNIIFTLKVKQILNSWIFYNPIKNK